MTYLEYIDDVFDHFVENEKYHEYYQQAVQEADELYEEYVHIGYSKEESNQKVIEDLIKLKPRLGFRLERKPVKWDINVHGDRLGKRIIQWFIERIFYLPHVLYWLIFGVAALTTQDGYTIVVTLVAAPGLLYLVDLLNKEQQTWLQVRYLTSMVILSTGVLYFYFLFWGNFTTHSQSTVLYLAPLLSLTLLIIKRILIKKRTFERPYLVFKLYDLIPAIILTIMGLILAQ